MLVRRRILITTRPRRRRTLLTAPTHSDPLRLGPFRLLGKLASGATGDTYLGQSSDGTLTGVKLLHGWLASHPDFRTELANTLPKAFAVLSLTAADLGGERPWLATEFVPGETLAERVPSSGTLTEDSLLALTAGLASALAHLHENGLAHRNLTPSSVLLAVDVPKLVGVDIVAPPMTRDTGPAADMAALASVLVFAGTGQGTSALPAMPDSLRADLARCLVDDPEQRPRAAELAESFAGMGSWPPMQTHAAVERTLQRVALLAAAPPPEPPRELPVPVAVPPSFPWSPQAATETTPEAPPAEDSTKLWPTVLVLVVVLAMLAGLGIVLSGATPWSTAPNVVAAPSTPPQAPSTPTPEPNAPPTSLIPGWHTAVSTSRNVAYDVPPAWQPAPPDGQMVFRDSQGRPSLMMNGVALFGSIVCPGQNRAEPTAWAGVTGVADPDTDAAALSSARLWSTGFGSGGQRPEVRLRAPVPILVGGRQGSLSTAYVTKPEGTCGSRQVRIQAVALPGNRGESVVWMMIGQQGDVSDDDLLRIIGTIRPAGMPTRCDPVSPAPGNWC